MQSSQVTLDLFGLPLGATFKAKEIYQKKNWDWCIGENGDAIGWVEKIISFYKGLNHFAKEHLIQPAYLLLISVSYPSENC